MTIDLAESVSTESGSAVSGANHREETEHLDPAGRALAELLGVLDSCISELDLARDRARRLLDDRRDGKAWLDLVTAESRPLVVEQISTVMAALATAGGCWRREQAHALQSEQVSINRIAGLFGVTRQRISALLRDRAAALH